MADSAPHLAESYLATALMLMQNNKVLLVYRSGTGYYDGYYALPGGKCDMGESVIETAIREGFEELDVAIAEDAIEFMHVMHRNDQGRKNWVLFFFIIRTWQGTILNKEPHKHSSIAWFPLDALPEKMLPSHKHAIQSWQQQKKFSVFVENK